MTFDAWSDALMISKYEVQYKDDSLTKVHSSLMVLDDSVESPSRSSSIPSRASSRKSTRASKRVSRKIHPAMTLDPKMLEDAQKSASWSDSQKSVSWSDATEIVNVLEGARSPDPSPRSPSMQYPSLNTPVTPQASAKWRKLKAAHSATKAISAFDAEDNKQRRKEHLRQWEVISSVIPNLSMRVWKSLDVRQREAIVAAFDEIEKVKEQSNDSEKGGDG